MKVIKQRKSSKVSVYRYRIPMQVKQVRRFLNGAYYPICPGCQRTIDREYMRFCDRCGQKLAWEVYEYAAVVSSPKTSEDEKSNVYCDSAR